jgi:SAM-dependent methyltransferase
MTAAWDGEEGEDRARDWRQYDRAVRAHQDVLIRVAEIGVEDRVLDIGCGTGAATREAALTASRGSALGVDLSTRMLERAAELSDAAGLMNVAYLRADVQVHPFEPASFDIALSLFGSMFFDDPIAAFSNVHNALRPGGRMVLVVWQPLAANEWLLVVRSALAAGRDVPDPVIGTPGPFGLADPDQVRPLMTAAGFVDVDFESVAASYDVGSSASEAYAFAASWGITRGMLDGADADLRQRALGNLRQAMEARATVEGVCFGSGVWVITAQRP